MCLFKRWIVQYSSCDRTQHKTFSLCVLKWMRDYVQVVRDGAVVEERLRQSPVMSD